MRNLFRARLRAERPDLFAQVPASVWRTEWVVNTQPVESGEQALGYLAAYVQRTALSAQRILKAERGRTTLQYRARDTGPVKPDGHGAGGWKRLTLDTEEFLRRFLQHVLPTGFHRACRVRRSLLRGVLFWLVESGGQTEMGPGAGVAGLESPPPPPPRPAWAMRCPGCGQPMVRLAVLPRLPFKPP